MSSVERAKRILAHIVGNNEQSGLQDPLITEDCKSAESSPPVKVIRWHIFCVIFRFTRTFGCSVAFLKMYFAQTVNYRTSKRRNN